MFKVTCVAVLLASVAVAPHAQTDAAGAGSAVAAFDKILDTYVRDGYVYYKALEGERAGLDRYVASFDVPAATVAGWSKDAQKAFWINAYNALVLKTAIDHYPIKGKSAAYPPNSMRQIPGAFDQTKHHVAGQSLTLDDIEKAAEAFGDARVVFALGRGAIGSGRLKSEAYRADRLNDQLEVALKEFVTRPTCLKLDRVAGLVVASPLFSWRQDSFVAAYSQGGFGGWSGRSPIERAILNMASPFFFASEREFAAANTFQMQFGTFDWRLNDLTGGMPN
jgi:hypothetical protein